MALATAAVTLFSPLLLAGTAQGATNAAVWHMDTIPMADSSGNSNNSTAMTGVTSVAGAPGLDQGYHFASNGSVTVANSASLNPGTEDFSISAYLNFAAPPPAGGDYDIIRKGLAATEGGEWKMEIFGNSTLSSPAFCLFKGSSSTSAVTVRGTTNLAGTGWRKITCTKTSTQVAVAVDGVVQKTNKTAVGSISNTADVSIGRKLPTGDQYIGDMDEVTITKGSASPADTTPPTVATTPTSGATGVAVDDNVSAAFNESVVGVSGTTFKLKVTATGAAVTAVVNYDDTTHTATLDPSTNLAANTKYTARLIGGTSAIRDAAGNPLPSTSWTFTTAAASGGGDTAAPTVQTTTPANTATGVAVDTNVTAMFSESVLGVSDTTFKLKVTATGKLITAVVSYDDTTHTATLQPSQQLTHGTKYTARLVGGASAIRDAAGNPLTSTSWTFTTA